MIAELFLIFSKILMYFKHGMVDILSDIIDLCFEM